MRRREFLAAIGSGAALPFIARAQQRVPRVGVLVELVEGDLEQQIRIDAFVSALRELGWDDGRNVQIVHRRGASDAERSRGLAAELSKLAPDVVLVAGSPALSAVLQTSRATPIVFTNVADPVGAGFIVSLARPGGNVTGFTVFEYGLSAKWLELLKEIAPGITSAAVLRDSGVAAGIGQFAAIQAVAPSFGIELRPLNVHDPGEIEREIEKYAGPDRGLIVTGSPFSGRYRELIAILAARHRLPAVYPYRHFVTKGGLVSYGPDQVDAFRRAAGYVDRILKGEKPADLPVQAPARYELVINLKTAKALGLTLPPTLLARADEVIE